MGLLYCLQGTRADVNVLLRSGMPKSGPEIMLTLWESFLLTFDLFIFYLQLFAINWLLYVHEFSYFPYLNHKPVTSLPISDLLGTHCPVSVWWWLKVFTSALTPQYHCCKDLSMQRDDLTLLYPSPDLGWLDARSLFLLFSCCHLYMNTPTVSTLVHAKSKCSNLRSLFFFSIQKLLCTFISIVMPIPLNSLKQEINQLQLI